MSKDITRQRAEYRFDHMPPCNSSYINPVVVKLCRQYGCRRILDLGCGNGSLCRQLVDSGMCMSGVDQSPEGVLNARRLVPEATFYEMSVYDAPESLPEAGFDAVVSTEVIEHLFQPKALPLFAQAKLCVGGVLMVSTPYHGFLKNLMLSLVDGWDAHHTCLWDGGHIKFWSRKTLTSLLEQNGFEVLDFYGVGRLPFLWKSMILVARIRKAIDDEV